MTSDPAAPEPVDYGQATEPQAGPTTVLDTATGEVSFDWAGDRPAEVIISTDLLENLAKAHNRQVRTVEVMRAVLQIVRLGRRPNRADWSSVGMAGGQGVKIDLEARRGQ